MVKKNEPPAAEDNHPPRRDRTRTYVGGIPAGVGVPGVDLDVELVPRLIMEQSQVPWHILDHRAGYLLQQVDGKRTCREIIVASGIDPLPARALLVDLQAQGCIELSEPLPT